MSSKYRKTFKSPSLNRRIQVTRNKQSRFYFAKKRLFRLKIYLSIILILLISGLIVYFLFFSNYSEIKDIKISKIIDYQLISEQELTEIINPLISKRGLLFSQKNILIFKTAALREIMTNDSRINVFDIEKDWPSTLIIKIAESKPVALLVSFANNKNCYLNAKGQVIYISHNDEYFATFIQRRKNIPFATLNEAKNEILPIFYDKTEVNLTDLAYVELLKNVLSLINCDILSQNEIKTDLVNILEKGGVFEVEIITQEKWRILINSEADFAQQINNLSFILKQEIQDRNNLEYIDLKFGERIFYKLKES
ncbi:hypothetical protein KKG58_04690 [Patescibacteria group bacterium]|nr:hypothetical protein [Patescibacteria group bacterium]